MALALWTLGLAGRAVSRFPMQPRPDAPTRARLAVAGLQQRGFASRLPPVANEPVLSYLPGSAERRSLAKELARMRAETVDIPVVIGDQEIFTDNVWEQRMPSDLGVVLARVHQATPELIDQAIAEAVKARNRWERTPFHDRAAVFLKTAGALAEQKRSLIMAATMLGQGKTVQQAEIDAACETIDFFRFACKYAEEMYATQPELHDKHVWNSLAYRSLEGFVAAISPFNFTAIGANLAGTPALLGNGVVWKPSHTASLSNYTVFKILRESGLPPGVINFVPCKGKLIGDALARSPDLAAVNFTGSTKTFGSIWHTVGENLPMYKGYPRLIGECGGKNFHAVHVSADLDNAVNATLRSAFEYQGQKCSACSRLYVPKSMWPEFREKLVAGMGEMKMGQVDDFDSFLSAVIDKTSFDRIKTTIEAAKERASCTILSGGNCDDTRGYFIQPTLIETTDHNDPLMQQEIFGPVLTAYVYDDQGDSPDADWSNALETIDKTSPYGLTGAIFATDRDAIAEARDKLRDAAGNIYINAKSTGAVVGQQPFGGSRASGTNDKAGAAPYLLRFVSIQSSKECLHRLSEWKYPHMSTDP